MPENLTSRGKIYLLIIFLSFVFSCLIITFNLFPRTGFALVFSIFATLVFLLKKDKTNDTKAYFAFTILFSLGLIIRSNPTVTLLNFAAIMFFGFLMLIPGISQADGLLQYIYSGIVFMVRSLTAGKGDYYLEYKNSKKSSNQGKLLSTIFGILTTIILLAIVLPLLSSANPLFKGIVDGFFRTINLPNLLTLIGAQNLVTWVIRFILFLIFIFLIPRILTVTNKTGLTPFSLKTGELPLTIPKFILALVILIFFITQMQLYFAGDVALAALGLSHSQRTIEVFTQLSVVAGIILILIYNGRGKDKTAKILNWILGISGIFLVLMAYKSVFEYINAWGLTGKRLFGLTFATWILGIFILFFKNYQGGNQNTRFIRKTIIFSGVILLLVNIFNFDYLIYHIDPARTGQGTDYRYLLGLSADSLSYRQQYVMLEKAAAEKSPTGTEVNISSIVFLNKVQSLQNKYSRFDFRAFNLLDYLQYKQVESLDTGKLLRYYRDQLTPPKK